MILLQIVMVSPVTHFVKKKNKEKKMSPRSKNNESLGLL